MTVALISPLLQCSVWVLDQERGPEPRHMGMCEKKAIIAPWISNLGSNIGPVKDKLHIGKNKKDHLY